MEFIPQNYFCHFEQQLDQLYQWQITVVRYLSVLKVEEIDIVVTADQNRKSVFSDNYLRRRSYVLQNQDRQEESQTSQMTFTLKENANKLDIYSRMVSSADKNTFLIIVSATNQNYSIMEMVYSIVTLIFFLLICCLCVICCSRIMKKSRVSEAEEGEGRSDARAEGQARRRRRR